MSTRNTARSTPVKRGAALLDLLDPTWYKPSRVSPATLNMQSAEMCLLGQAHNDYCAGLQNLATAAIKSVIRLSPLSEIRGSDGSLATALENAAAYSDLEVSGHYYGFHIPDNTNDARSNAAWEKLGTEWTAEILERRKRSSSMRRPAKKPVVKKATRRRA